MISFRAIFQAFWTIQLSERSCRAASSWISLSMGVVIFIALTLAIFAVLGLVQKLVEGL